MSTDGSGATQDKWAVGWIRGEWSELWQRHRQPLWIHPPPGHFYADPFVVIRDGQPFLFFEDYLADRGKGHIACRPLSGDAVAPALRADFHLSYPFLLEWQDELFCIPEQHEAGKVSLYRCLDFPSTWTEETVLVSDFPGVDPTLLCWEGHWYMWLGHQEREARHQVFLYQAPALTGPWSPHQANPVIKLDWKGRNGGTIVSYQGRLLRPAQNRTRTYGGSLVLHEICELSPRGYQEREWAYWEPDPGWPYPDGMHHVCSRDGFTVIDAKLFVEGL